MIFLILISLFISKLKIQISSLKLLEKYWIVIAWIVVLVGVYWIMHFLGYWTEISIIRLLLINIIFWLLSYLISYKDWKMVWQFGYYTTVLTILIILWVNYWFLNFLTWVSYLWILTLWIVAFILFILWIKHEIEKYIWYKMFLLVIWGIVLLVLKLLDNEYVALVFCGLILNWIFYLIYKISQKPEFTQIKKQEISVRRILAGERITSKTNIFEQRRFYSVQVFIKKVPKWAKWLLEFSNSLMVLSMISIFLIDTKKNIEVINQLSFWAVIILFVANVILLIKSKYKSLFQRFVVFVVLNFAIYASLWSFFKQDFSKIATWAILRNLVSWIMIFYIHKTPVKKLLGRSDYHFWFVTTLLALFTNIFILTKIPVDKQLVFSLAVIYLWIQWFILFYANKFIKTMKNHEK